MRTTEEQRNIELVTDWNKLSMWEQPGWPLEVGDGLDLVKLLLWNEYPNTRSLVISDCRDMLLVERCFRAGAIGYLCKLNVCRAELVAAIRAGGPW